MSTKNLEFGKNDTSYNAAGQYSGIAKLVNCFYDYMETLPAASEIRAMHPEDLQESREKLIRFLCGWLGGPKLYREKYGPIKIPLAHAHLVINEPQRDAWLSCMQKAVDKQSYSEDFKRYLMEQLYVPAERIRSVSNRRRAEASNNSGN